MIKYFCITIFLLSLTALAAFSVNAQIDVSTPSGVPRKEEPLPKIVLESRKKDEIEREKKDHQEMIKNGEEAVKLSEELAKTYEQSKGFSSRDLDKLERLEKLLKKIRKKLGGDDDGNDDEIEAKPTTIESAVETLKKTAASLFEELKKTSRLSISAVAIQSSNTMLKIVRLIRFWKK